jgi:hypothetical protein
MHLRFAGFVPGATTGISATAQPNNAANGILGVQTGVGAATMGFTSNMICTSNMPDKIAIAVETQMDDGVSATGQVRGMLQGAPNPAVGAATANPPSYQETGTNQYLLCKNL